MRGEGQVEQGRGWGNKGIAALAAQGQVQPELLGMYSPASWRP